MLKLKIKKTFLHSLLDNVKISTLLFWSKYIDRWMVNQSGSVFTLYLWRKITLDQKKTSLSIKETQKQLQNSIYSDLAWINQDTKKIGKKIQFKKMTG